MAYLNETEEVRNLRNAFCKLIEHGGSPAMCKIKQWAALKNAVIFEAFTKAGIPVPAAAVEPFGLRPVRQLIRDIRSAYRDWDENRIDHGQFRKLADGISREYGIWETLDRVSSADRARFTDEFDSSVMAAGDIIEL